ncbi:MAG: type IV toxin-antitoxin system AbiEi family antitoxin domain-containing protein, partial [Desulfomonilia bacterium]
MKKDTSTIGKLKLLPKLFRIQDAEKVSQHAPIFLSRACQKGLIHRLSRGNYINSFLHGFPTVEEVACFLKPPAYLSCEWALYHHGIILQAPQVCSVITLHSSVGKSRSFSYQGIVIEFSRIAPRLFQGFSHTDGVFLALPEKAILDTLYFRRTLPVPDELDFTPVDR